MLLHLAIRKSTQKRRAISTVIGAFLFIILLMAALGVFVSWMQFQSDYLEVQLEISKKGFDKLREDFSISANYDSTNSNRLYVNVTNAGSQHVEIVDLFIVNSSLATKDAKRYDIGYNDAFVPISSTIDVLKNQALYMTAGTYNIKIVSVLGTTKTSSLTITAAGSSSPDSRTLPEIILPAVPFAKPEIFMSLPSPFGDTGTDSDKGYFSMSVVNPTNQTMTITSIAFYATGGEEGDDKFFKKSQTLTEINPASGWTNTERQVFWQDVDNPISILKYGVYNFTVGVSPDKGNSVLQAVPITGSVYTSYGQFSISGHSTGSSKDDTVIANVYLSPDSTDTTPLYAISGVTENLSRTYYVSVENTATKNDGSEILANSLILINIPNGFTNILNGTSSTELDPQSFDAFADGSIQIPVKLNTDMDESKKWYYSFTATAPDVEQTTLYVFHILGSGKATDKDGDKLEFGPVAETVVQVCPSSGC